MRLRVTYAAPDASPVNVQITADATATAGDVARALARGASADQILPDEDQLTLEITDAAGRHEVLPVSYTHLDVYKRQS